MSRRGNPASGIIRRSQLRPRPARLTAEQLLAVMAIEQHDGIDVEELARAISRPVRVAASLAVAVVEKNYAVIRDRRLYIDWSHYRASRRTWRG